MKKICSVFLTCMIILTGFFIPSSAMNLKYDKMLVENEVKLLKGDVDQIFDNLVNKVYTGNPDRAVFKNISADDCGKLLDGICGSDFLCKYYNAKDNVSLYYAYKEQMLKGILVKVICEKCNGSSDLVKLGAYFLKEAVKTLEDLMRMTRDEEGKIKKLLDKSKKILNNYKDIYIFLYEDGEFTEAFNGNCEKDREKYEKIWSRRGEEFNERIDDCSEFFKKMLQSLESIVRNDEKGLFGESRVFKGCQIEIGNLIKNIFSNNFRIGDNSNHVVLGFFKNN